MSCEERTANEERLNTYRAKRDDPAEGRMEANLFADLFEALFKVPIKKTNTN